MSKDKKQNVFDLVGEYAESYSEAIGIISESADFSINMDWAEEFLSQPNNPLIEILYTNPCEYGEKLNKTEDTPFPKTANFLFHIQRIIAVALTVKKMAEHVVEHTKNNGGNPVETIVIPVNPNSSKH